MAAIVLVLLAVAGGFVFWLRSPVGALAAAQVRERPRLLLAPAALFIGQFVIEHLPPGLASPFFSASIPGVALAFSVTWALEVALDVFVLAWFAREVERSLGREPVARLLDHAGCFLVLHVVVGLVVLGTAAVACTVGPPLGTGFFLILGLWSVFLFWFSSRTAPILAALARDPTLTAVLARGRSAFALAPRRWRTTVLAHLAFVGSVTVVYYVSGSSSAFHFNVSGASVVELTTTNAWPNAIGSTIKSGLPDVVFYGVRALTAVATALLVAGYLVLGDVVDER